MSAARRCAAPAAIAASCAFFGVRLFRFIDRHAVNVLFWDQWDYLQGLRRHVGLWDLFSWIHGPHRMGLGYLFIAAVYRASGWDNRAEAFATAGLFVVTLALALILKHRAVSPLTWADACIPALVLTTAQFEVFIGTPNAAHGPLPLFLVVLSPFLWLVPRGPLRALLGGALVLCAAFTGFAIFLVPGLIALFCLDALRAAEGQAGGRWWDAAGAILSAAALALFFHGYRFASAAECFQFPDPRPLRYVPFAGLIVARPLRLVRLVPVARFIGPACFVLAAGMATAGGALVLRRTRTLLARTIFLFASFSTLFVLDSAVGRVCLGMGLALSSRYVPYVTPLWLAAWFALSSGASRSVLARRVAASVALALLFDQALIPDDVQTIRWYSEGKARWRACFLASGDESACNASTRFRVYPVEGAPQVEAMRRYLRDNRLNLYEP